YSNVQKNARDSIRQQDIATIKKALLLYQIENGGVSSTPTYGGTGNGGWDTSDRANWLAFLRPKYGNMPVDPVNTPPITYGPTNGRVYFYYCYPAGQGGLPATTNVRLGYRSERTDSTVATDFAVENCL